MGNSFNFKAVASWGGGEVNNTPQPVHSTVSYQLASRQGGYYGR